MDVKMPDGVVVKNVPDGTTQAELLKMYNNGKMMKVDSAVETLDKNENTSISDYAKGIGAGALRGAADIGNTLINASTFLPRTIGDLAASKQSPMTEWNNDRESSLDSWTQDNKNLPLFDISRIGANIAGTLGVGGVLGKAMQAVPALAKYAPVVESGGFNLGNANTGSKVLNALVRGAGGAMQGGAQTALVDPELASTGAAIGAVTPGAVKVAGKVGSLINNGVSGTVTHALGASTGAGADAVSNAYQAGKRGATSFLENMRGDVPFDDVVGQAKEALGKMRLDRQAAYKSGMMDISKDKTILNFSPIDLEMKKIAGMGTYKGVQINKNASGVVNDIVEKVNEWKSLSPAEYHTPEGLDALKQAIGDIRDTTQFGTAARKAADSVYNAVKNQITMQAPTYSKVMKNYSEASKTLSEIESALSLGNKAKADTAIRKLQSLMRNNAQTSYGNRLNLANTLDQQGGSDLMPAIAGQAMNSWTPRGMVGAIEKAGTVGALGASVFNPAILAPLIATAPLTSPRIVGNMAYGLGRASGGTAEGAKNAAGLLGLTPQQLLDQAMLARTLPLAISASQAVQR